MKAEFNDRGFDSHNIWRHSAIVRELYRKRARGEAEEMTCAAQAAELLTPFIRSGDSVLDAGCGSGYFFHSLAARGLDAEYHGFDATAELIELGRNELPAFGLPVDRLRVCRLEDFQGAADHVLCMNVLSNIDNFHRPLERLLLAARKTLILRESIADAGYCHYVVDEYLDPGVRLKVHVNTYARREIMPFIESYGFEVEEVVDRRTMGATEMVIGYPHAWTFLRAVRSAPSL